MGFVAGVMTDSGCKQGQLCGTAFGEDFVKFVHEKPASILRLSYILSHS